jgi:hypothetical protein
MVSYWIDAVVLKQVLAVKVKVGESDSNILSRYYQVSYTGLVSQVDVIYL